MHDITCARFEELGIATRYLEAMTDILRCLEPGERGKVIIYSNSLRELNEFSPSAASL